LGDPKGFSLIELMVVITLVATLMAISWPSYTRWQERETLSEALMRAKAAVSQARSRSVQNGLYWGSTSYDGKNCSRLRFGVAFNASSFSKQYYCETTGDQTMGSGEIFNMGSVSISSASTGIEVGATVSNNFNNNRVFFRKNGTVVGADNGTVQLSVGGKSRSFTVISTGRISE